MALKRVHSGVVGLRGLSMTNNISHSGYIRTKGKEPAAYDFDGEKITMHLNGPVLEEDTYLILAKSFENKSCLFYSQIPFSVSEHHLFPINHSVQVDWIIMGYEMDCRFDKVQFDFEELQFFCPSISIVQEKEDTIVFSKEKKQIKEFDFEIAGRKCHASFDVGIEGNQGIANSHIQAKSVLTITFEKTSDFSFLESIYNLIDETFSFVCNRRNTDCTYMNVMGVYPAKTIEDKKVVDCERRMRAKMHFLNKYRESNESNKVISKAFYSAIVFPYIDKLISLIAKDIDSKSYEDSTIYISSIHPSTKRRNLIDLQQSLQITGAFEFYSRKYLPSMRKEKEYHTVIKMVLLELVENSLFNRKARETINSLIGHVVTEPALADKIVKAYQGYGEWRPLKNCLKEGWFDESKIQIYAKAANDWRNELAHSKRDYEPNLDTIIAVRLMEHMNYAIVLRQIGMKDEKIAEMLENILVR